MNIFKLLNNDIQDLSEEERIFAESFNEALRNNIIDALVQYEIEELIKQLKNDEEGFRKETELIKQLGFDGKSVINPRQVEPVHEIYTPTQKEIEKSIRVIKAAQDAKKRGSGVVSLNGKMIDKPIIERAERALSLAKAAGLDINFGGEDDVK